MENIRREARFQMSDECKKGEDEISCYIDMGGAAGAKKMITGSLSLLGETYSLTLKLVDLKTTSPINSVFKQKKCKPDQLFQLALEATQELLGLPPTQIRDGIKIVQENLSSKRADKNVSLSKTGVKTNFKGNLKVCTRQSKVGRSSKGGWEKFCIPHLSCPPGSQVVTDKNSGLVWMKKSLVPKKEAGKTDQKVSTVTKPYYLPQQQAAKLCHSFGSDWRLPQVDELESLLLFANQVSKAKLAACFPNLKGNFWTATHSMHFSANKYIVDQATLWQVDFVYGLVNPLHKKNSAYVLCVKREATVLK